MTTTTPDHNTATQDGLHDLMWRTRLSALYHLKRERFLDGVDRAASARRHAELARDYRMLEADAAEQTTWTADNLALFESRFHRLQATEPATLGALVTQCHNELAAGMGAHGHITPLRWHERLLKNWLDFDQSLAQSAKT